LFADVNSEKIKMKIVLFMCIYSKNGSSVDTYATATKTEKVIT
jgi:hypothetical protein